MTQLVCNRIAGHVATGWRDVRLGQPGPAVRGDRDLTQVVAGRRRTGRRGGRRRPARRGRVPVPARAELIGRAGEVLEPARPSWPRSSPARPARSSSRRAATCRRPSTWATSWPGRAGPRWGETVPSELPDKMAWTTRQPVGVVGMITPWNFPVAIPSWKCFPALLAGNGIVLKPSEHAPACAEAFVDRLLRGRRARRPRAAWSTATPSPAAALAVHPGVGAVSFTGSVPTGRTVAAAAMATGPRLVSLELGGKNAMVVLPDADLDLAVDGALFGAFGTAGQRCTSTSRLVVHRDVADELVERIAERAERARARRPDRPGDRRRPGHQPARRPTRIAGDGAGAVAEGAHAS